jgi:hypothetical protein
MMRSHNTKYIPTKTLVHCQCPKREGSGKRSRRDAQAVDYNGFDLRGQLLTSIMLWSKGFFITLIYETFYLSFFGLILMSGEENKINK